MVKPKDFVYDVSELDHKSHMQWVAVFLGKGVPESEICRQWQITPETLSSWKQSKEFRCRVKIEETTKLGVPAPSIFSEEDIGFWEFVKKFNK